MLPLEETALRLFIGAIIGGVIGFEREVHGRAAGFRTQLIVCVASVLIMIVSENYYYHLKDTTSMLRIDPARIAAGALIGIGFLGAGVIVKSGFAIRGLTTAASIWIVSAIGLAVGAGLYFEGLITAVITVMALVILRKIEKNLKILLHKTISISTQPTEKAEEQITTVLSDCGIRVSSVEYEKDKPRQEVIYYFSVYTQDKNTLRDAFYKLGKFEFVKHLKVYSREIDR